MENRIPERYAVGRLRVALSALRNPVIVIPFAQERVYAENIEKNLAPPVCPDDVGRSRGGGDGAARSFPVPRLGRDGAVAPSERIVVGGIGIGNRGTYDLGCFLEQKDVQFVAVCDVKAARRDAVKKIADTQVRQPGLRDVSRLPRAARPPRTSTPC